MKKYQYVVAVACVLVGAVGFASMYAIEQSQKKEPNGDQSIVSNSQQESQDSQTADVPDTQEQVAQNSETESGTDNPEPNVDEETPVGNVKPEELHFAPEKGLVWPVEGPVLLDYSMDATIYYPTLAQYQYSPAMVLGAAVNDKVYFVARGKITDIKTNEETGCTVTQDLGDGYTAIYGQLKELNFEVGDMVESGQVVGYINEPTKYYSVEGPNVYFQILKDGKPIDPEEILDEES